MITDIQRFSIHDGQGTRTTVFFKGCPLCCKWCHNPETQDYDRQIYYYRDRCTGCGLCREVCEYNAIDDTNNCALCGKCISACNYNARRICGEEIDVDNLVCELMKDEMFYETSGGGVTLSGGEVLSSDIDYLTLLISKLYKNGISVNIDTCGYVSFDRFEKVLPYTDVFLYDIKLVDADLHRQYTGLDNGLIIDNLIRLNGKKARIWIRLPIIGGVNNNTRHINSVGRLLIDNNINYERISLLPYHKAGSGKYEQIGSKYSGDDFYTPDENELNEYKRLLMDMGLKNIFIR